MQSLIWLLGMITVNALLEILPKVTLDFTSLSLKQTYQMKAEDVWFTKMIILCILLCNQSSVPPNTCYKTALNGKGITNMCLCKNMNRKFWNLLVSLMFTGLPLTSWPTGTRHLIVLLPHCHHEPVLFWYSVIVFSSIFHDCRAQFLQKLQNLLFKVIMHYNTHHTA